MRIFADDEHGIVTEPELRNEFYAMRAEQPREYDYSFERYVQNCINKNGSLIQLSDKEIQNCILAYVLAGALGRAREVGNAWRE